MIYDGSVFVGDQKVAISVPRVRHKLREEEVQLESYRGLQSPGVIDDMVRKSSTCPTFS